MATSGLKKRPSKNTSTSGSSNDARLRYGSPSNSLHEGTTRLYLSSLLLLLLLCLSIYAPSSIPSVFLQLSTLVSHTARPGSSIVSDTPYIIVAMQDRGGGMGVVASRAIEAGTLLMSETPIISFSSSEAQGLSPSQAEQFVQGQFDVLSSADQLKVMELSNAWEGHKELPSLLGILQTNAMQAAGKTSLFPTIARINHACAGSANAVYHWNESVNKQEIRVVKRLAEGQEVFLSYWDSKKVRDERQRYLQAMYGFTCSCRTCSLSTSESKLSDERLVTIQTLKGRLGSWISDSISGKDAISLIEGIVELMHKEDINYELGQLYADATRVAASHSDYDATKHYANLSTHHFALEIGTDATETRNSLVVAEEPRRAIYWGTKGVEVVR
ncbi:hypothetical protein BT69DRAFT_1243872 [Atractiella rhizophila]|nr:hypothetical protein BT69DRAFT_1243872 [Atractiella rhizophila]